MKNKGLMFVFGTAVISGFSIFINKFGVKGIDSSIFAFSKNFLVSLLLIGLILGFKEFDNLKRLDKKQWGLLVLVGLVGGSIPFLLFFRGLQLSSGAVGSLIHKSMFIFVAILAVVFLKERLSKKILIPAVLLIAGNLLLLRITSFELTTGALFVLGATLFWSVENVISKHLLKEIEPKILAFGRLFFGSIFIMVFLIGTGKVGLLATVNVSQLSWIFVTSIFLLLYVFTWYTGLRDVKVTTATSILLLGSPITTLLSFIFLGTALSVIHAIGILLIICGVGYILLLDRKIYLTSSTA